MSAKLCQLADVLPEGESRVKGEQQQGGVGETGQAIGGTHVLCINNKLQQQQQPEFINELLQKITESTRQENT